MTEPDKLARWDPRHRAAWMQRLVADCAEAERVQTPEMRRVTAAVVERALRGGASAVALTGSTTRERRTAISDLDFHVVGRRPGADDLPADVDVYAGDEHHLQRKLRAGDDFVQWTLRWGCVLVDHGVLRRAAADIVEERLWPGADAKLARLGEHRRLAERLLTIGDRDAAHDQVRAMLTSAARGLLLAAHVFPLARAELPDQLRAQGRLGLADALERAIHGQPSLAELRATLETLRVATIPAAA